MVDMKSNKMKRALALLVMLVLLLNMLPLPHVTAATKEHPGAVTITVKDAEGSAIENAAVDYVISDSATEVVKSTLTTDANGTVEVLPGEDFAEGKYTISATVTREGYVSAGLTEQSITAADQDFVVTLEQATVPGITVTPTTEKYTGEEFPAVSVTGYQSGDTVTITVNEEAAVILNADGTNMPQISDPGTYTVKVEVSRAGYAVFSATVESVISKNTFVLPYEGISEAYTGAEFPALKLAEGAVLPEVDKLTYTVNEDEASETLPTISAFGEYKIHVHAEKYGYEDFNETYISKITLGVIYGIEITALETTYDGEPHQLVTITGADKDLYTITLTVDGEATTYSDEKDLKKTDAGKYTIKVTLSREFYEEKTVEVTAIIAKAPLAFTNQDYQNKGTATEAFDKDNAANNVYDFSVSASDLLITYTLQDAENGDEPNFATIDKNGNLTITGAGSVIITATPEKNDNYNEAEISFTLTITIEKGDLVKFEGSEKVEYVFGANKGLVSEQKAIVTYAEKGDTGTLSYRFEDEENKNQTEKFGLQVGNDAKVTIVNYSALNAALVDKGSIEVTVVVDKAECCYGSDKTKYPADSDSYTITISYADISNVEEPYSLTDPAGTVLDKDTPNGENGWYNTAVTVFPAKGYTICREITEKADSFDVSVPIEDQGEEDKYVYLQNNETGEISKRVLLKGLKIDTVAPSEVTVDYQKPSPADAVREVLSLGFYQSEVKVRFEAKDETSGVDHFEWQYVPEDGVSEENAAGTIDVMGTFVVDEKTNETIYYAEITLSTTKYGQMRGKIIAKAVDDAGNNGSDSNGSDSDDDKWFVLDDIAPNGSVSYTKPDGSVSYTKPDGSVVKKEYFNQSIEFEVKIEEINFFSEDVEIKVTKDGKELDKETGKPEVSWEPWKDESEEDASDKVHRGTFTVDAGDGEYTVTITYRDRSQNEAFEYTSPTLVIDKTPPIVSSTYRNTAEAPQQLLLTVEERNFNPADIDVDPVDFVAKDITGADVTVNQEEILSFIHDEKNWSSDNDTHSLTITRFADANYNLTFRYADLATNPAEKHSNQFTIDHTAPDAAKMTVTYSAPVRDTLLSSLTLGFYQPQVTVTFTAYDVTSGVKTFNWGYDREAAASSINLAQDAGTLTAVQDSEDKTKFTASISLPQDVADQLRGIIHFTATDSMENESLTVTDNGTVLVVDSIAPRITNASYSTPSATIGADKYYNNPATLTLTFNEANFFQEDVNIVINREGGGTSAATVSWVNNSVDEHLAIISFPAPANGGADGHYTVTADYTDRSNNRMQTFTSDRITIDTTAPTISVRYDDGEKLSNENYFTDAANAKYFKSTRQATITIVEHNFDANKVTVSLTTDRGAEMPTVSGWSSSGDTHTATVAYTTDGDYTFDVSAVDIPGNNSGAVDYGDSAAPREFTIDTKSDMITIAPESVSAGKAYTYDDVIIPDIRITDDNLEGYEITLTGVQRGKTIDLSDEIKAHVEEEENVATALLDVFRKEADLDGIYTLTVRSTDLADNTDEQSVCFTVNRFGSVYAYGEEILALMQDAYRQSIGKELSLTIYNASPITPEHVSVLITRDGAPVEASFTVDELRADGEEWYSYLVTIAQSNFAEDGIYAISVTTTDDAQNTVENTGDNSDGEILFYVDSTAPQLTSVSGMEERIVNATELKVSYTVFDTIGLASVQVKVDGEIVDSATEFDDASNYTGSFTIHEKSSAQHVSFVLTDKAGNVTESDAEDFAVSYALEKDITVSTNLFVRWYANKGLFWGSIGGVVAVAAALSFFFAVKRKKKATQETKTK